MREKNLKKSKSKQVAHETISHYWSSYDGSLPSEMPRCGFDGGLCDYTMFYVMGGLLLFTGSKKIPIDFKI